MYVLANRDIELSCNETVVKSFGETVKSTYALILIGKLIMAAEPMCNTENIIDIFLTEAFCLLRLDPDVVKLLKHSLRFMNKGF